jgi:hypothetical protein
MPDTPSSETAAMLRRSFLAASLLLAAAPALAAGPTDPVEIVKYFYSFSAGKSGKWEGPSAFFDKTIRKTYFSPSLLALLAEEEKLSEGEIGAIDYDPISNSQDPSVRNLKILPVSQTVDAARVGATFTREAKATAPKVLIYYDFVREGGAWKLNDMLLSSEDGAKEPTSSIRADLETFIKETKANPPKP